MGPQAAPAVGEPGGGQPRSSYVQLLARACERSGGRREPERCRTSEDSRGMGRFEQGWVGMGGFGRSWRTSTFWRVWRQ